MHNLNKNKKQLSGQFILSLVIIVAGFLLLSPNYLLAQSDSDANTNTNTTTTEATVDELSDIDWEEGAADDETLRALNQQLDEKRQAIEELNKKTETYEKNIKAKQQERITLGNQLTLLDMQVEQTELDIETVQEEVAKVNIEIDLLGVQIEEKAGDVGDTEQMLAAYIRLINHYDNQTLLELFISNDSFSDFFDQMQYAQNLEGSVKDTLLQLKDIKAQLEQQEKQQLDKRTELTELSEKLSVSIVSLTDQKEYKSDLIEITKESEEKFEALLEQARREQQAAQSEMNTLELKAREKLEEEGIDLDIDAVLMWPMNPAKGISAYFHDPTYPFRRYFEHPGIDLPVPQGSIVRAAENGYVVRAKNAGLGYSYVMIVHNNEISTVYGHISRIDVAEDDYVIRGQQVGLSGGLPGTPGAGRLSTGAHLHFEVRFDGIPVNPLDYLPSL